MKFFGRIFLGVLIFCLFFPLVSFPAQNNSQEKATIIEVKGDCLTRSKSTPDQKWSRVSQPGHLLSSGDDLMVRSGNVEIQLCPQTTVRMDAVCMATYSQGRENIRPLGFIRPDYPTTKIKVTQGSFFAKVCPYEIAKHFVVFDTPAGVAGVRGTELRLIVGEDGKLNITVDNGSVVGVDKGGNFTYELGGGVSATLVYNEDGSFSIQSIRGEVLAYSPNTTFTMTPGAGLTLNQGPDGATEVSVTQGSVSLQVGNVTANLTAGQSVETKVEGNKVTVENTGNTPVAVNVGNTAVTLTNSDQVQIVSDTTGNVITAVNGNLNVNVNGKNEIIQEGSQLNVDPIGNIVIPVEPCTPSVSPYKPCT